MNAYLFTTDKNVKLLVFTENEEPDMGKKFFKIEGITHLEGALCSKITYVGTYDVSSKSDDTIDLLQPEVVINNGSSISLKRTEKGHAYYYVSCDLAQLKKYYSIFLLINQIKSIKANLGLE